MKPKRVGNPAEITRQAFRRAASDLDPNVSGVMDAVPAMLAEARRRRAIEEPGGTMSFIVPVARRAIPRLAAAAVVLVALATFVGSRDTSVSVAGTAELDRLILTGEANHSVSDVLLEAITRRENDNG